MRPSRAVALSSLLLLLLSACGYALVGRGGSIDPSIKRIGVPTFKDPTGHAGLDQQITQKVIEELLKRGRFDVVQESTGVDALVEGELVHYAETPVSYGAGGTAGEAQVQASRFSIRLVARVKYSKTGEKEPIWSDDAFSFTDTYDVGEGTASFIDSEEAIERLASAFARKLVADMLEAF